MSTTTAFGNEKGGVGKTTLTLSVASELARQGRRVLVVDVDAQAHASSTIYTPSEEAPTIVDLLAKKPAVSLADVAAPSKWGNVDVIPGSHEIELLERDPDSLAFMRLRRHLRSSTAQERYDDILIDLPPSIGTKTVSGLYAAHRVIAVTVPEPWSMTGLSSFLDVLGELQESVHPHLRLAGVTINRYDKRLSEHQTGKRDLIRALGAAVLEPYIPNRVGIVSLAAYGTPAFEAKSASAHDAADAIARLTKNLINSEETQ